MTEISQRAIELLAAELPDGALKESIIAHLTVRSDEVPVYIALRAITRALDEGLTVQAVMDARAAALEEAAKVAERAAALHVDLVFQAVEAGLPDTARNREAMEAMATRLAISIRALKSSPDSPVQVTE